MAYFLRIFCGIRGNPRQSYLITNMFIIRKEVFLFIGTCFFRLLNYCATFVYYLLTNIITEELGRVGTPDCSNVILCLMRITTNLPHINSFGISDWRQCGINGGCLCGHGKQGRHSECHSRWNCVRIQPETHP